MCMAKRRNNVVWIQLAAAFLVGQYLFVQLLLPDANRELEAEKQVHEKEAENVKVAEYAKEAEHVNIRGLNRREETADGGPSVGISLLGCSRFEELELALASLQNASAVVSRPFFRIYLSLDCRQSEAEWARLLEWRRAMRPLLNLSYSLQADAPPDPEFRDERVARHMLSNMRRAFSAGHSHVVHMEDDHVVSLDFFPSLLRLIGTAAAEEAACLNMGCHRDCWGARSDDPDEVIRMEAGNMGAVYSRAFWARLVENIGAFCEMRGNWDVNIHVLQHRGLLPAACLTYALPRIHHLPTRVSSRTSEVQDGDKEWAGALLAIGGQRQERNASRPLRDLGAANYQLEEWEAPAPEHISRLCLAQV